MAREAAGRDTASPGPGDLVIGGQRMELRLAPVSVLTFRVTLLPIGGDGFAQPPANSPELAIGSMGPPLATLRTLSAPAIVDWGGCRIRVTPPAKLA